jgi:capsular polysaccharide export protein
MPHPASLTSLLKYRRVLLLQGPMGPFFARLAGFLEQHGQAVYKVNFNGGDQFFYRRQRAVAYTGTPDEWPEWLRSFLIVKRIDAVVVFGQTRPVHAAARAMAGEAGAELFVFEEGYLRPDYVTLECGGVNGYSGMPRCPAFYGSLPEASPRQARPTHQRFSTMAWYASVYSWAVTLMRPRFPHHVYHRPIHPVAEALRWARGGWRKLAYAVKERNVLDKLTADSRTKRWFLLPLQVHNDSQIVHHSRYDSVEAVIDEVMASFAAHAPSGDWLVIKHHPMDRAYSNYARYIEQRAAAHGVSARVRYVHDLHLPTLLKHAKGVVTVNSTTGLQSLFHKTPVIALGDCFYNVPGLLFQGGLASFWQAPGAVDEDLYQRFRQHLVANTQLNASFYGAAPALDVPVLHAVAGGDELPSMLSQPAPLTELRPPALAAAPPLEAGTGRPAEQANDSVLAHPGETYDGATYERTPLRP